MKEFKKKNEIAEIKKEARKLGNKKLEEYYALNEHEVRQENPSKGFVFKFFAVMTILVLGLFFLVSITDYAGTEFNNYATFGKGLCEKGDLGKFTTIEITREYAKVYCEKDSITIPKSKK